MQKYFVKRAPFERVRRQNFFDLLFGVSVVQQGCDATAERECRKKHCGENVDTNGRKVIMAQGSSVRFDAGNG